MEPSRDAEWGDKMAQRRRHNRPGPLVRQPPFNSDHHIHREFARLAKEFGVQTIVETGTCVGNTTLGMAKMAPYVHTVEIAEKFWKVAEERFKDVPNITLHRGNSAEVLDRILPSVEPPVMFYLDAHWNDYWPLLDEIRAAAKYGLRDSLIVIHDFQVPGKRWGFDRYKGKALNLQYVKPELDNLYGAGNYHHYYNTQVAGAKRGVLYVTPGGKA
jgi:predicted O-methyltransferase YrrM